MANKSLFGMIITIALALIMLVTPGMVEVNGAGQVLRTTTVEVERQTVDYQSIGTLTTFTGYKTIDGAILSELDLVNELSIEEDNCRIFYKVSYNEMNDVVTLEAIIDNCDGEVLIDTIYGIAFINEYGEPDAILDIDGEYILLSELQNVGMIQNCGWFKKLIAAAVAAVVVTTVVAVSMATAGAALGAVVGVCAAVGAVVGGTASVIAGITDGEISFGQICANFGAGLVVGGATGALTGFVVGKIACYNVAFSKGSFNSVNDCVGYHFAKHGAEVGASNATQYVNTAMKTARTVIRTGVTPVRAVAGATANVMRYEVGGYYIHMAIDGLKVVIVSFGLI